ncbi:MAG TPA: tetratricopeptide repeat protein, partial [Herpetosiphonaceae bacterium]|nr:tetratricopeptide repeat protein [Herpetosiphonaceae bacterium]
MLSLAPRPLSRFIGREHECAAVTELLRTVRLLTLTGPGGSGKTRLALHTITQMADRFIDGTYFVNLVPITDHTLVLATIAETLGLAEQPGTSTLHRLQSHLSGKNVLIVLDNFEHVIEAALDIAALLTETVVTILVTSRVVLHIAGEQEYRLPPLSLPDIQNDLSVQELSQYDTVRLFLDRAQSIRPDFSLTAQNAKTVIAICSRLDGLPLAIELAAARLRILSPDSLLPRLDQRLDILTTGGRNLPVRHQTLRNAITWSYDLLTASEQLLWRRLAIFIDGFSLAAVEELIASMDQTALPSGLSNPAVPVLDRLEALVDQSLLRLETLNGQPRLSMLATMREYALEQMVANGELEAAQRWHADFFVAFAEEANKHLTDSSQHVWLLGLSCERSNLRGALDWSLKHPSVQERRAGLRLCAALWRYWWMQGHLREGRSWLERALAAVDWPAEGGDIATTTLQARLLSGAGALARGQADYRVAQACHEASLPLLRALNDIGGLATAFNGLGNVAYDQGNLNEAWFYFQEALRLRRELNDTWGCALLIGNLGMTAQHQGQYAQAHTLHQESLALMRSIDNVRGIAYGLKGVGMALLEQGDLATAEGLLTESHTILGLINDQRGMASSYLSLGYMYFVQEDYGRARAPLQAGLSLYQDLGDGLGQACALVSLGDLDYQEGQIALAHDSYRKALGLLREKNHSFYACSAIEGLARIALLFCRPDLALALYGATTAHREDVGAPVPPTGRSIYERTLAEARTHGDSAMRTGAWNTGQSCSFEQMVELAMQVPGSRPINPPQPSPNAATPPAPVGPGQESLTARELHVLRFVAKGL